jgi:hypothetical protein
MVSNQGNNIKDENKNLSLSHQPSAELLEILNEFKSSMIRPTEIFERFVIKAREENFTNFEINLILSRKELKEVIPSGSMDYYKKKFGLTNLAKSQLTKSQNNLTITTKTEIKEADIVKGSDDIEPDKFDALVLGSTPMAPLTDEEIEKVANEPYKLKPGQEQEQEETPLIEGVKELLDKDWSTPAIRRGNPEEIAFIPQTNRVAMEPDTKDALIEKQAAKINELIRALDAVRGEEEQLIIIKLDANDTKDLYFQIHKKRLGEGFMNGFKITYDNIEKRLIACG